MLFIRIASSPKTRNLRCMSKRSHEVFFPAIQSTSSGKSTPGCLLKEASLENQSKRLLHTAKVHNDLETGLKAVGAGLAAIGASGPGVGIGIVFGNFLLGATRNPSVADKMMGRAIVAAAFCESIALFCLMISFIILM